ncbi:DUF2577 domain-containing protein [Clostridium thermopalmarium]|uniref:DUF2577 domain-containing protein n=1 Tax=Clostridium thermopalmarium TaxID=29373 RepID=UPI0023565C99|nr:DUF2577 domain-containing protein [Clostridium thermopalmarium]
MDPYVEILTHMRNEGAKFNPPSVQLGEMISSDTLKLGELQITKSNLYFADYLLKGYERQITFEISKEDNTKEKMSVTYKTDDELKPGDIVAVLPTEDRQTYIILAKVVSK